MAVAPSNSLKHVNQSDAFCHWFFLIASVFDLIHNAWIDCRSRFPRHSNDKTLATSRKAAAVGTCH
jgi:hypothetical protein